MTEYPNVVSWFSCGIASATATKLALNKYGNTNFRVARIVIPSEHEDNERFARECSEWFAHPIIELRSGEYADTWDVWERRHYLAGPHGAPCTIELKKKVREGFQQVDDVQVFGYTYEERDRAERFREQNHELTLETPLIDLHMTRADCFWYVHAAGIEYPEMYRLGYRNNNCIGCVKGGAGYWNKIRKDFPDTFERMANLEESLGARLVMRGREHITLRELHPKAGRYGTEDMSCGPLCQPALL